MMRPDNHVRRGPLDRWHAEAGAELMPLVGGAAPWRYPHPADMATCALADLTALPRAGFKGWNVWSVLGDVGIVCPRANNTATEQTDGGLCLRLGDSEALLLGSIAGLTSPLAEPFAFAECDGFYPVPRRETHVWLLLLGSSAPSLFSKVCAVDFRLHKFGRFEIAQTHVAGVSAVITRRDIGQLPSFHLLTDTATASYLWSTLLAAGREYDARPIGLEAVQHVAQEI